MNNTLNQLTVDPNLNLILASFITSAAAFIPKLLVALLVFFIFKLLADYIADLISSIIKALNLKQAVQSFDLGLNLSDDTLAALIRTVGLLTKYIVIYLGLVVALQTIGLNDVAQILLSIFKILPRVVSSLVILLIGVILAGFMETIVKKALVSFDPATARLGGKTASYTVVSFFGLMSLAELGLAATFINTLFIGLVFAISLAFGLGIGLGAKDLVREILENWYTRRRVVKKNVTNPKVKIVK